jgi:hypothetical protein
MRRAGSRRLARIRWTAATRDYGAIEKCTSCSDRFSPFFDHRNNAPCPVGVSRVGPFWSRFESLGLQWIFPRLPDVAKHSVSLSVGLITVLWLLIGVALTLLLLAIPPIRKLSLRQQFALVVLFPCIALPAIAIIAPFEPGM